MKFKTVGIKTGNVLYTSHKEAGENTVETSTKDGKIYHHEEYENVEGKLTAVKLEEGKFGERLKLFIEQDKDNTFVLEIPTIINKELSDWAVEMGKFIGNLKLNKQTKISTNKTKLDKNNFPYKNLFITQDEERVDWAFELSEIPKPVVKTKLGKDSLDFEDRDDFVYKKIKAAVEGFKKDNKVQHMPSDYKTSTNKEEIVIPPRRSDDLPF